MALPAHDRRHQPPAARGRGYERHRPEETVLYQVLEQYWSEFQEQAAEQGGLPRFVRREVEEYLRCGRLEYGCLRLCCEQCGHEELVAFSCKRRGFCPGCLGRRMTDTALNLVQQVLPRVQVRQWVCSLPFRLRALCGYHSRLCAGVVSAIAQELSHSLRHRAKKHLGLGSMSEAHTGSVTFVQRFDSALRLNEHLHVLVLDGVYLREPDGPLGFHQLPEPSAEDVADIAERTARRIQRLLKSSGSAQTLPCAHQKTSSDSCGKRLPWPTHRRPRTIQRCWPATALLLKGWTCLQSGRGSPRCAWWTQAWRDPMSRTRSTSSLVSSR